MTQTFPSVPLVTCDPYFSIWSPANHLYDCDTCNWTGAVQRLTGALIVDGKEYRWMGIGMTPKLPQTGFELTPTASVYTFANEVVQLVVTFCTPLLLSDLELVSRPVSYISLDMTVLDGKLHEVTARVTADETHCYEGSVPKPMLGGVHRMGSFDTAWLGQRRQAPLSQSGDEITIDWGYLYLATPAGGTVSYKQRHSHYIEATLPLNPTGKGLVCVAYDDIDSIRYFGDSCKGYWARDGKTILQAIGEAFDQYSDITARCREFDSELMSQCRTVGGEDYATLCAAAYRQSIAAHKLVEDRDGNILFISKESSSNGCAATVDISYPSMPLYLLYQPELVKGMLRPVFKYASLPVWGYDFAPHDVGRYPYVWGQVYALKEHVGEREIHPANYIYPAGSDIFDLRDQMPVEECGNMLVMTAAVVRATGDIAFAEPYMPILEQWVKYLLDNGEDPGDQLCTDDFAGHLAHNANLSVKAIVGIESFAMLLRQLGRTAEADSYHSKAVEMAKSWERRADAGDHTVLCFGDKPSWSIKYNMIWDKLFDSELFADKTYSREREWYLSNTNDYGVPLDSRRDYTKTDWILWAATFCDQPEDIARFCKPIARFLQDAPQRNPFSDWYDTKTAEQQEFHSRSVQGGLFMPLLRRNWRNK